MSERFYVGTRKGLFTVARRAGGWAIDKLDFLGEPVTQHLHDPRDGTRYAVLTLGHFGPKLRRSADGGATWETRAKGMRAAYMPPEMAYEPAIQDPHRLVQCPADPEALWVQHHNGIFRSRDGGASWDELSDVKPSSFGFAVAVHPHN